MFGGFFFFFHLLPFFFLSCIKGLELGFPHLLKRVFSLPNQLARARDNPVDPFAPFGLEGIRECENLKVGEFEGPMKPFHY